MARQKKKKNENKTKDCCIVEVNDKQRGTGALYIYSALVSAANGYIPRTLYNKLQTIHENLFEIEEGQNAV